MEALAVFLAGFGIALILSSRWVARRERVRARRDRRRAERAARRAARPRPELNLEVIAGDPDAAAPIADRLVGTAQYRRESLRRERAVRAAERAEMERRIPRLTGAVVVLLCVLALIGGVLATGGLGGGGDDSPEQSVFATPGG